MNNKMLGAKPLYVALAQRKEDRKAQLASQYMQRLAAMRMQNPGGMPGTIYNAANGGFFVQSALPNQRAFMPNPAMSGGQVRGAAPRWNNVGGAAGFSKYYFLLSLLFFIIYPYFIEMLLFYDEQQKHI